MSTPRNPKRTRAPRPPKNPRYNLRSSAKHSLPDITPPDKDEYHSENGSSSEPDVTSSEVSSTTTTDMISINVSEPDLFAINLEPGVSNVTDTNLTTNVIETKTDEIDISKEVTANNDKQSEKPIEFVSDDPLNITNVSAKDHNFLKPCLNNGESTDPLDIADSKVISDTHENAPISEDPLDSITKAEITDNGEKSETQELHVEGTADGQHKKSVLEPVADDDMELEQAELINVKEEDAEMESQSKKPKLSE